VNASAVNCEPWSVLKMVGFGKRVSASGSVRISV
jgi:hypothetical protein